MIWANASYSFARVEFKNSQLLRRNAKFLNGDASRRGFQYILADLCPVPILLTVSQLILILVI